MRWISLFLAFTFALQTALSQGAQAPTLSVETAPSKLMVGSPFLLTVKVATGAAAVKGRWQDKDVLFFKGSSRSNGELWHALLGVDVDSNPGSYPLSLEVTNAAGQRVEETRNISVLASHYRSSALQVAGNFVEPDSATQKEIESDKKFKEEAFAHSSPVPAWSGDFVRPVPAGATDSFGTRRTFNGKLASVHHGMDFRAAAGTPVRASNSGRVVVARKLFYEGNCVVIDHGENFRTLYMHLSRIQVAEGSTVRKGQLLGLSGATGRVTGPHLHFAARWQQAYLDPAGLFRLDLKGQP